VVDRLSILKTIKLRKKKVLRNKSLKMTHQQKKNGQTLSQETFANLIRTKLKATPLRRSQRPMRTIRVLNLMIRARNSRSQMRREILTIRKSIVTNKCRANPMKN
jgi:hypothetical protein